MPSAFWCLPGNRLPRPAGLQHGCWSNVERYWDRRLPTSAPAGRAGEDWTRFPMQLQRRHVRAERRLCCGRRSDSRVCFDQASSTSEYWTLEAKGTLLSEGPFNFLLGVSAYDSGSSGDYYVAANTLDLLGILTGAYPATFNSTNGRTTRGLSRTDRVLWRGVLRSDRDAEAHRRTSLQRRQQARSRRERLSRCQLHPRRER